MIEGFSLLLDHLEDESVERRNCIKKVSHWSFVPKILVPIAFADLFPALIKVGIGGLVLHGDIISA
jgi:hypothetical protein